MLFRGVWFPAGLCSAGSDTLQDFVKRGIRPRRTLFCGVSDPAEQMYAIKCSQLCHCSAGSDTPQDLVLRGLIPRRTTLKFEYIREFEPESENVLGYE
jgi:hypothetical protein